MNGDANEATLRVDPWAHLPDGDYAIVELFGHATLVGKVSEVERFGTRMLAIEPLFDRRMLGPVYHGGAAIYRLTPCGKDVAWINMPTDAWHLPPSIRAVAGLATLDGPRHQFTLNMDDPAGDERDEEMT